MADTSDLVEIEDAERDGRLYRLLDEAWEKSADRARPEVAEGETKTLSVVMDALSIAWGYRGGAGNAAFRRAAGMSEGDE